MDIAGNFYGDVCSKFGKCCYSCKRIDKCDPCSEIVEYIAKNCCCCFCLHRHRLDCLCVY